MQRVGRPNESTSGNPHIVELTTVYPGDGEPRASKATHFAKCECGRVFQSTCYVDVISWAQSHVYGRI